MTGIDSSADPLSYRNESRRATYVYDEIGYYGRLRPVRWSQDRDRKITKFIEALKT